MSETDKTMKAMMGLLYGALTDGGNGSVEQNERERFICWCLPGIPIDPEELRYETGESRAAISAWRTWRDMR